MSNRFTQAQQDDSREAIKNALLKCTRWFDGKPVIYTVLRSVSKSGMTRKITPFVVVDGIPVSLAWHYDRAYGREAGIQNGQWANKVQGSGMDAGFHLAEDIASIAGLGLNFRHEWL